MTVATQDRQTHTTLTDLAAANASTGPAWLRTTKKAALSRLLALGFPTTRHEEWRFTSVAPITQCQFALPAGAVDRVTAGDVEQLAIPGLPARTFVFVNNHFAPELSDLAHLPRGLTVAALTNLTDTQRNCAQQHLAKHASCEDEAFTALNTAMLEDGLFIHVARGAVIEPTIVVLNIAAAPADGSDQPLLTSPRHLIVAEENSGLTVLEHYVALDAQVYFTNAVTEIVAGENAVVNHYLFELESEQAFNFSTLAIHQARSSNVASHSMLFGGALVRNNVHPVLDGPGAHCLINGLYLAGGRQHMDNHMRVEHAKPNCDSRQFYKGILTDHARTVFSGRIVVKPDAQKTDAKQTNANLLLSGDAQANTRPQLEIYADDVKCTHGATVGQIDENAVFYLQSRGISRDAARALMTYAFAAESFERVHNEPLRQYLESLLVQRLPNGAMLNEVL